MTGTKQGGEKAAAKRGHGSLSEAGKKGGSHSHKNSGHVSGAAGHTEAAKKGGEHSHSGSSKNK